MKRKLYFFIFLLLAGAGFIYAQTTYDFRDKSIFYQGSSADGRLTLGGDVQYHGPTYGLDLRLGGAIHILVDRNCVIKFLGSAHSHLSMEASTSKGVVFGKHYTKVTTDLADTYDFVYDGDTDILSFTAVWDEDKQGSNIYLPLITIEYGPEIIKTEKIDVWDFGAAQLDEEIYNNRLTVDIINSWYPGVESGTEGVDLAQGFTVGALSWTGGSNDRIRTSNTSLTRKDSNGSPASFEGETLTGSLYVNAEAATGRYFSLVLGEDDELTLYAKTQGGKGKFNFEYMTDDSQKDIADVGSDIELIKFVAKKTGTYRIYDSADKPYYYRILRKDATYVTLSGTLNTSAAAGIPQNYSLILTNEAGKAFSTALTSASADYSISVPAGYTYTLSLADANGFIISNGSVLMLEENTTREIVIQKVDMRTLSGSVTGLNREEIENLELVFIPENEDLIYIPIPVIDTDAFTYTVDLEPNAAYTISANGVNDYYIADNKVNISADAVFEIAFTAKPTYKINITADGLDTEKLSKMNITFENLYESGYRYNFNDLDNIYLRDGVYFISTGGMDEYPLELAPTSNLKVEGADASKNLEFRPVSDWTFNDTEIVNGVTTAYKGLLFTGKVSNETGSSKGHLVLGKGDSGTVCVPLNAGEKLIVTYYYTASFFVIDGDTVETASKSTSVYETVEYVYQSDLPGYMSIINTGEVDTYITGITTTRIVEYSPEITVGADKQYQTINEALSAIRSMNRPGSERIKIMVDPGNYEEMLLIDMDSISIINASATPNIALKNQGVDIDDNAVRITSYYGHGYDYYSMGTDQKWSEDALRVNKENGYTTYSNTGSGTGNGSYWNATVVVSAAGFEASHIIFENSFNQYISRKESEDVVIEWESGGKGTRPTEYGSTEVQNKSFVERAAAIAYTAGGDKSILYKCRVVGRQDSFYGAEGARIVAYKGSLMGGTDYLFGGMTLVAYKSDLAMNTSEVSSDVAYITAAQQNSVRGFLMYNCTITSAMPGTETASEYLSKPGYLGRPWQANTSEVVFYNTIIKATNNPGYSGQSMILPIAWLTSLGGQSDKCYEYGTIEESGVNNSAERASWTHILETPVLNDGTEITTFNFTKGNDDWDPIPYLIENDVETGININRPNGDLSLTQFGNEIQISGIDSLTNISIYGIDGALNTSFTVNNDTRFILNKGFWIVNAYNPEGRFVLKTLIP